MLVLGAHKLPTKSLETSGYNFHNTNGVQDKRSYLLTHYNWGHNTTENLPPQFGWKSKLWCDDSNSGRSSITHSNSHNKSCQGEPRIQVKSRLCNFCCPFAHVTHRNGIHVPLLQTLFPMVLFFFDVHTLQIKFRQSFFDTRAMILGFDSTNVPWFPSHPWANQPPYVVRTFTRLRFPRSNGFDASSSSAPTAWEFPLLSWARRVVPFLS